MDKLTQYKIYCAYQKEKKSIDLCIYACVLVFATVLLLAMLLLNEPVDLASLPITEHQVQKGDTLWHLAYELKPDGARLQEYIHEVRKLNGFEETAMLMPGQVLKILDGRLAE